MVPPPEQPKAPMRLGSISGREIRKSTARMLSHAMIRAGASPMRVGWRPASPCSPVEALRRVLEGSEGSGYWRRSPWPMGS